MHAERIIYAHPLQKHARGNYEQWCVSKIYKSYSLWTESHSFILNVLSLHHFNTTICMWLHYILKPVAYILLQLTILCVLLTGV